MESVEATDSDEFPVGSELFRMWGSTLLGSRRNERGNKANDETCESQSIFQDAKSGFGRRKFSGCPQDAL
jgi:hypothetical protein